MAEPMSDERLNNLRSAVAIYRRFVGAELLIAISEELIAEVDRLREVLREANESDIALRADAARLRSGLAALSSYVHGACHDCRWRNGYHGEPTSHCENGTATEYASFPRASAKCSGFESMEAENLKLRAELESLKADRDECRTCDGDGVVFGVDTKAEGGEWVQRKDPESTSVCPGCDGTKLSAYARMKADLAFLKKAGRALDEMMYTWACSCVVPAANIAFRGVQFDDIRAERDALRALCQEKDMGVQNAG